ncbi:ParA family partition ATPase [Cereibacter sphaeroides]|uniref:ParA family partition ATPase n=1 Tax=Cereibacter sphaeroides TaxID=1063 RepID=UPI001F47C6A6|nr:ParA family partition ATPase [Cereibacter sphaeroides]MCE6967292.1 AAA family ATPase [Cereibacter sphaeroides]
MSRITRVIAVATQKGGAGKSTIAIHLAVQAMQARKGALVILLDLDPQGSVAGWAARRDLADPVVLQAMPGNLEAYLAQAREDDADFVVIDTPPHAGATIDAAVRAADLVVIPIRPGPFDIDAAAGTVEILKQSGKPGIFVLSQVTSAGSEGDDTEAVLKDLYPGIPVAEVRLGQRKAFMKALISGQAITEFDRPSSKAVGEIKALFRAVAKV